MTCLHLKCLPLASLSVVLFTVTMALGTHLSADEQAATPEASQEIRQLIPAATAIDQKVFEKIASGTEPPTRESFDEPTLTAELFLISFEKAQNSGGQFRYLTKQQPKPARIAQEMYHVVGGGNLRVALKPVTMIQAERITKCDVEVDGNKITGTFRFHVPDLYEGAADFVAVRTDQKWKLTEIQMDRLDIRITRDATGRWKRFEESE